jgi:hypothetical protein
MNAELPARRRSASAVLAYFGGWTRGDLVSGDWQEWALRLAAELQSLIASVDEIPAGDPAAVLAQVRAIFDTFDWTTDDRQYALEQIEEIVNGDDLS